MRNSKRNHNPLISHEIKSILSKGAASVWQKDSIKAPAQLLVRGNIGDILISSIKKQRDPPIRLNGITIGSEQQPVRGRGGVKNRRVGKIVAVETGLLAEAIVVVVVERGLLDKYFHRLS